MKVEAVQWKMWAVKEFATILVSQSSHICKKKIVFEKYKLTLGWQVTALACYHICSRMVVSGAEESFPYAMTSILITDLLFNGLLFYKDSVFAMI